MRPVGHSLKASHPGSRIFGVQIIIPIITTTTQHVPTTTTATRGTHSRATPHHDCNSAAVGQHHAPSTARKQSRGRKTSSLQWENGGGERVCQHGSFIYQDENDGGGSSNPGGLGIIICAGRSSRGMEGQPAG